MSLDNKDLSFLPNYVTGRDGVKYYTNTIVSMNNRVSAYEVLYGRSPAIVYVNDSHGNGTTSNTTDSTLQKCYNAFGEFNTIDEFLSKIQGKGYGYYYNSKFYKESSHTTEIDGESGKIYTDLGNNKTYRWSGTTYTEISASLALGETESTAYPGNKGKANAANITTLKSYFTNGVAKQAAADGNTVAPGLPYLLSSAVLAGSPCSRVCPWSLARMSARALDTKSGYHH